MKFSQHPSSRSQSIHRRKQGVALLMALVVVAIASTIATDMWFKNQLSLARSENLFQSYQSKHYAKGMMLWASDILKKDFEQNQYDTSHEPWHQSIDGLVVENAVLSGRLSGMNNKFNVNNLYRENKVSEEHLAYFIRLLTELELDVALADKIIDWIDPDTIPKTNGAEDFAYLARSVPHKTASKAFQHISQLKLIDGLSEQDYKRLIQYVCVLPTQSGPTRLNINTIPAVMIKALDPAISRQVALSIYQEGNASYNNRAEFYNNQNIRILIVNDINKKRFDLLLDVSTTFLQAESRIAMAGSIYQSYALIERSTTGQALVKQWSTTAFILNE